MTFLPETKKSEILTIHGRDALIYQPPRSRGCYWTTFCEKICDQEIGIIFQSAIAKND